MPTCTRAELEQELGLCYHYDVAPSSSSGGGGGGGGGSKSSSLSSLLHYYVPRSLYHLLHTPVNRVHEKRLLLCPDPQTTWILNVDRPPLMAGCSVRNQSLYYRSWTQPRKTHYDFGRSSTWVAGDESMRAQIGVFRDGKEGFHPRRLLLSGPPQVSQNLISSRFALFSN